MNKPLSPKDVTEPKLTTEPLSGSRKVYSSPEGHADLSPVITNDVLHGLPPLRKPWVEARSGGPVTQLELARAGIITPEMIFIAHRENIGRQRQNTKKCKRQ